LALHRERHDGVGVADAYSRITARRCCSNCWCWPLPWSMARVGVRIGELVLNQHAPSGLRTARRHTPTTRVLPRSATANCWALGGQAFGSPSRARSLHADPSRWHRLDDGPRRTLAERRARQPARQFLGQLPVPRPSTAPIGQEVAAISRDVHRFAGHPHPRALRNLRYRFHDHGAVYALREGSSSYDRFESRASAQPKRGAQNLEARRRPALSWRAPGPEAAWRHVDASTTTVSSSVGTCSCRSQHFGPAATRRRSSRSGV